MRGKIKDKTDTLFMFGGLIYLDDFQEIWIKLKQRGTNFILSKFNFNSNKRTISAFNTNFEHANWWIIPHLKQRMNAKISGDISVGYEQYVSGKYFDQDTPKVMISLGCGAGSHEITFANINKTLSVNGYDLSEQLIKTANLKAEKEGLKNVEFIVADVYKLSFENESVDFFLFNAALHHFKDIEHFITNSILPALKKDGLLIINEYVGPNRMHFSNQQIAFCNEVLEKNVPESFRKILSTNILKNKVYRHGTIRMTISDPSECIDSENILPVIHKHFNIVEEKALGGNILMPVLKHISHHFIDGGKDCLEQLCNIEDEYLKSNPSQFVFGIYTKNDNYD